MKLQRWSPRGPCEARYARLCHHRRPRNSSSPSPVPWLTGWSSWSAGSKSSSDRQRQHHHRRHVRPAPRELRDRTRCQADCYPHGAQLIEIHALHAGEREKETATKSGEHRRKKGRQPPVTVASLRLSLRPSTGLNCPFQPQSLGRVRDPVRIAEGPRPRHGSNAGHRSGVAGVDARRATPPDPRLARWGLASCCQLDPSHPAEFGDPELRLFCMHDMLRFATFSGVFEIMASHLFFTQVIDG